MCRHFQKAAGQSDSDEMWLEYEGQPLKWWVMHVAQTPSYFTIHKISLGYFVYFVFPKAMHFWTSTVF